MKRRSRSRGANFGMFLFLSHATSIQIVIIFVKHLVRKSNCLWGALQHARTQKLSAQAGIALRRIIMEDHHAEYIFIHPSGERLARERAAVLWHPVWVFSSSFAPRSALSPCCRGVTSPPMSNTCLVSGNGGDFCRALYEP